PAPAAEVEVLISNDAFTFSPMPDDLYTFGLRLEVREGSSHIALEERSFTDRGAGVRFDETYLTVGRRFGGERFGLDASWRVETVVGVAMVGEGLLGASAQNTLHRWLGSEHLELDYLEADGPRPHLRISLVRLDGWGRAGRWRPWVDLEVTEGLQASVAVGSRSHWRLTPKVRLEGAVGVRLSHAEFAGLRPWVEAVAPTLELSSHLARGLRLIWSYNTYGTGDQHWHLGFDPRSLDPRSWRDRKPGSSSDP
ncbi:MAG: hypothetical protein MI919_38985, partial [Holophagales bacterium]|nr:hypothetical protein [Holophagales bacterium]